MSKVMPAKPAPAPKPAIQARAPWTENAVSSASPQIIKGMIVPARRRTMETISARDPSNAFMPARVIGSKVPRHSRRS